ncbi:MAG: TatD family hydrolase [Lachnospiraceae bacterium]|nr:TatD family hydrolase [Lachnospiraceae bacterium]
MIFDTHAHYDDEAFDEDRDELLSSMEENGVGTIINVGASVSSSRKSIELAHKYSFIYAAVGIHPEEFNELDEEHESEIRLMIENEQHGYNDRIAAVGEIGLDYHWAENEKQRELQRESFKRQLEMAKRYNLPAIIHSREAAEDTFNIIEKATDENLECVIHCYSGSPEMAIRYTQMGHYIGVGGVVTFKNGKKLKETVARIPMEKLLLETDCPYMSPEPYRGKRNDSTYIKYVVKEIAAIRGMSEEDIISVTEKNARRFYMIGSVYVSSFM